MTVKIKQIVFKGLLIIASLMFVFQANSQEEHGEVSHDAKETDTYVPYDPGETIIHHLASTHQIHIIGSLNIPLPVIIYSERGLDIFMSSKMWDEHNEPHNTYTSEKTGITYAEHHNVISVAAVDGVEVAHGSHGGDAHGEEAHAEESHTEEGHAETTEISLTDLSITKSIVGMFLILLLMVWLFTSVAKAYKKNPGKAPKGIQNMMETLILFVKDDIVVPSIGEEKSKKFLPFLLSVFFFIWICNLLGLVPFLGGFNITGTIWITVVLSAFVFIITMAHSNKHYWSHLLNPPGVPFPIKYFILVPIELIQIFMKPAVLMIRLTANIAAGHIIILAFVSLIIIFGEASRGAEIGVAVGSVAFMIFMFAIELLVAFLQAYVFTLLASLYFADATQDAHH